MQLTRRPDQNYDMTFGQGLQNFATGGESVRICVASRIRVLLGEWFLDTGIGLPYMQKIITKPADPDYTAAAIKACILATDEVTAINDFSYEYDKASRLMSVSCSVSTSFDTIETIEVTQ